MASIEVSLSTTPRRKKAGSLGSVAIISAAAAAPTAVTPAGTGISLSAVRPSPQRDLAREIEALRTALRDKENIIQRYSIFMEYISHVLPQKERCSVLPTFFFLKKPLFLILSRKYCRFLSLFKRSVFVDLIRWVFFFFRWPMTLKYDLRAVLAQKGIIGYASPTSRLWTAASLGPFKIDKLSNRHRF